MMSLSEISKQKQEKKISLLKKYSLSGRSKPLIFINIDKEDLVKNLIPAFARRKSNFIVMQNETKNTNNNKYKNIAFVDFDNIKDDLSGLDAVIGGKNFNKIETFGRLLTIPVLPQKNYLSGILSEYNPMDSTGEVFLYQDENIWDIFAALVRFEENFNFVYDRKILQKNILKKFVA